MKGRKGPTFRLLLASNNQCSGAGLLSLFHCWFSSPLHSPLLASEMQNCKCNNFYKGCSAAMSLQPCFLLDPPFEEGKLASYTEKREVQQGKFCLWTVLGENENACNIKALGSAYTPTGYPYAVLHLSAHASCFLYIAWTCNSRQLIRRNVKSLRLKIHCYLGRRLFFSYIVRIIPT